MIPPWTLHDLRRSAATHMQELGISDEIIDATLGHKQTGLRARYNQSTRLTQKKAAFTTWNTWLERRVAGEDDPTNVVSMGDTA